MVWHAKSSCLALLFECNCRSIQLRAQNEMRATSNYVAAELMGRTAVIANEACPGGICDSKSQVRCRNLLKPRVRWRWGQNAVIPPVLFNKSFSALIKYHFQLDFFPSLVLGVFESCYEIWKNAEFLILSQLRVLYKCQSWCGKIWDTARLLCFRELG